jgi:hypothetical protein
MGLVFELFAILAVIVAVVSWMNFGNPFLMFLGIWVAASGAISDAWGRLRGVTSRP